MVIGKAVSFTIEYTNTSIKREFGTVELDGVNVNEAVVAEGWAKVRPLQGKEPQSEYVPKSFLELGSHLTIHLQCLRSSCRVGEVSAGREEGAVEGAASTIRSAQRIMVLNRLPRCRDVRQMEGKAAEG